MENVTVEEQCVCRGHTELETFQTDGRSILQIALIVVLFWFYRLRDYFSYSLTLFALVV